LDDDMIGRDSLPAPDLPRRLIRWMWRSQPCVESLLEP